MREALPFSFFGTISSHEPRSCGGRSARVDAPCLPVGRREAQLRERNPHLDRPAAFVDRHVGLPDGVPAPSSQVSLKRTASVWTFAALTRNITPVRWSCMGSRKSVTRSASASRRAWRDDGRLRGSRSKSRTPT